MSKTDDTKTVPCSEPEKKSASRTPLSVALLLVMLAAISGLALGYKFAWREPVGSVKVLAMADRLERLEQRVVTLEKVKLAKEDTSPTATLAEIKSIKDLDLPVFQKSLASLAGSLEKLEKKFQESSVTTQSIQMRTETGLSIVLAFVQMQQSFRTSLPFEKERIVLRGLIGKNPAMVDLMNQLEPYALQGVETPQALYKEWRDLEPFIQAAVRKAGAKTWQDRILVALVNLISIRTLGQQHGKTMAYGGVEKDLAMRRIGSALKKAEAMPVDVQLIIEAWHKKTEAHHETDQLLKLLASRLIAKDHVDDKEEAVVEEEPKEEKEAVTKVKSKKKEKTKSGEPAE